MKAVARLWRGQYGLAKTWWLFGVLGTALLNLISAPLNAAVAAAAKDEVTPIALGIAALLVAAFGLCYGVVASIGIARAAMAYTGNRLWAWLAVTATAAAWLAAVAYVVTRAPA